MATHSCSCLENPRDAGAWWAAIYGVMQSRTWLKWLSSSSSSTDSLPCKIILLYSFSIVLLSLTKCCLSLTNYMKTMAYSCLSYLNPEHQLTPYDVWLHNLFSICSMMPKYQHNWKPWQVLTTTNKTLESWKCSRTQYLISSTKYLFKPLILKSTL